MVSNIDIVTVTATYTSLASTFPVRPFEFVFVPPGPLIYGALIPALVLLPSPQLTDSGGLVFLSINGSFDGSGAEGVICDFACDGVTTSHQIDAGGLSGVPIPEPSFAPLLGLLVLFLVLSALSKNS